MRLAARLVFAIAVVALFAVACMCSHLVCVYASDFVFGCMYVRMHECMSGGSARDAHRRVSMCVRDMTIATTALA